MSMTFGGIAKAASTAAMAGVQGQSSGLQNSIMSKEEKQALAIGKVAEANIIEPKEKKSGLVIGQKKEGLGLTRQTYNQLGQMGQMTALKQAGASSLINETI